MVYDVVAWTEKIRKNILTTENTEGTKAAAQHKISKFSCAAVAFVPSVVLWTYCTLSNGKEFFSDSRSHTGRGSPPISKACSIDVANRNVDLFVPR